MTTKVTRTLLALVLFSTPQLSALAQGAAFVYQGRLDSGGSAAGGVYDFTFAVWDAASGGAQQGATFATNAVIVSNGCFAVTVDCGSQFNGNARWLEIAVRTNGAGALTTLNPRQPLTPVPYAIFANTASNLSGALPAAQLSAGTANINITGNAATVTHGIVDTGSYADPGWITSLAGSKIAGGISGNAATATTASGVANNAVTASGIASGQVVKSLNGLTDGVSLAAGANVTLATNGNTLTLAASGGWNLAGNATPPASFLGTTDNNPLELWVNNGRSFRLEPTANSANIIAGFKYNSVLAGVYGATIAGGGETGYTNRVNSSVSAVGGGSGHRIDLNSGASTIAGGGLNTIRSNTYAATIAGGYINTIATNSQYAAIGGGSHNAGNGEGDTIAGGEQNATANLYSTVSGGVNNAATNYAAAVSGGYVNTAGGQYSAVGGGQQNIISGDNSVIPGGSLNLASGTNSFAAGTQAQAVHNGALVWADSQAAPFASTANNQASFRCLGGVRFTSGALTANQTVSWAPGSSSWSFTSDRNAKDNFAPVDGKDILEKLSTLALSEWSYQGYPQRHIGPMAQDFHALFPLNDSETMLNDTDLHGVALAAIQGLNQKLAETVKQKDAKIAELEQRLAALEQLVQSISTGGR